MSRVLSSVCKLESSSCYWRDSLKVFIPTCPVCPCYQLHGILLSHRMTEQQLAEMVRGEETFGRMFFVCDAGAGALPDVSDRLLSKLKWNGDNIVVAGISRPDSQVNLRHLQQLGEMYHGIFLCEECSKGGSERQELLIPLPFLYLLGCKVFLLQFLCCCSPSTDTKSLWFILVAINSLPPLISS